MVMQVLYQSEAAECGLVCMAMVAQHYGRQIDLTTLRNRYGISLKGANLHQLMQLGQELGLTSRALKLELNDINQLQRPCVLHWEMNHFVVLKRVRRNGITVLDPAQGERRLSWAEVDKAFTGVALELTPNAQFSRIDERVRLSVTGFWSRAQGLVPALARVLLLSGLLQLLILAAPYYTQLVVDEVLVSYDQPLLTVVAVGFGLLMLLRVFTQTLRSWVVLQLSAVMSVQMASNVMRHLLHLPQTYFERRHIGDVVSRFGSLNSVRELVTNSLVEGLIDGVMASVVLVLMYLYSPLLTVVVVGMILAYALVRWSLYGPLHRATESSIVATAKEQSHFMESVRGMQSITLFGLQTQRLNTWQNRFTDAVNQTFRLGTWQMTYTSLNQLLLGIENIVVVYLAARAVMTGDLTVGMLFAFLAYKNHFTQCATSLIDKLFDLKMIRLHIDRLADIVLTEQEPDHGILSSAQLTGQISLSAVRFRYASNEPLLFDDLSLDVQPGEKVAIIGPSGSGKTSLLKIILGLITGESGKVEADGVDIRHLGLRHYRNQVAAVMQDDQLMSGTLAENISFFDAEMDMQHVIACAQIAGIHQDIAGMPMGYHALVGDMGSSLSGGQKQRLLLARALYRRPKILFMDEATSHLDIQLEHYVNAALRQLNITQIIIAHRPHTILQSDRVLQLREGRLEDITVAYRAQVA